MSIPTQVPYDPQIHKGYLLLMQGDKGYYVPPAKVPGLRSAGWKTVKEYQRIAAKRLRRNPVPHATTVGDLVFSEERRNAPTEADFREMANRPIRYWNIKDKHPVTLEPLDAE
jgi:hypothetical protein